MKPEVSALVEASSAGTYGATAAATPDEEEILTESGDKDPEAEAEAAEWAAGRLLVYTLSTFVFGMICSALGPTIPWLAESAGIEPEALGWLPAAQSIMCIVSGLASGIMALVPRKYHHLILCLLLLWLAGGFALIPACRKSLITLTVLYAVQVLPRPWIGQMTNLLVSELHTDVNKSSAAQSFNQGGFALGCVVTLLISYLFEVTDAPQNTFFVAAAVTAATAVLFLMLPRLHEKEGSQGVECSHGGTCDQSPGLFTSSCAGIGVLAVGVEVACGTWLITSMIQTGFSLEMATVTNIVFWLLFAASRLAIAPVVIILFKPEPASVVVMGAALSGFCCLPAIFRPDSIFAVLLAVSAVAVGGGPAYAMTITMAKQHKELTSADSALFSVAASLGAGVLPFLASRLLQAWGAHAFFVVMFLFSALMLLLTAVVSLGGCQHQARADTTELVAELDLAAPISRQLS